MSVILEEDMSFSESMVWRTSRDYYIEKGVSAWSESVPFYITSNMFIANQYADILLATMQSWVDKNRPPSPVCFSLLEIGAGCGQLAYSIIRLLNEKIKALNISRFSFHYIISDLSEKALDFIASHPLFKPYIESGQCRFSCFDLENDNSIELLPTGDHPADTLTTNAPLLLIANYLFDSLTSDVFYLNKSSIQESRVSLSTDSSNLEEDTPKDWDKVKLSFNHVPIGKSHYEEEEMNSLLYSYQNSVDDTHMIFPIGSLRAIQRLRQICQQPLFILLSDKCFNTVEEMRHQPAPYLDVHGSFSTMVNLDALSKYCKHQGGTAIIPTPREGLTTAVLAFDIDPNSMPLFTYSIRQHLEGFSPTDFFNFYDLLTEQHKQWPLPALVSALTFSHWDSGLFSIIVDRLESLFENGDSQVVDYLTKGLPHVADNFYPIPAAEDVYFQVASLYYTLDDYDKAITYYLLSLEHYPNDAETLFNLSLCHLYAHRHEEAKQYVKQCLEIDPNNPTYKQTQREIIDLMKP